MGDIRFDAPACYTISAITQFGVDGFTAAAGRSDSVENLVNSLHAHTAREEKFVKFSTGGLHYVRLHG